MNPSTTPEPESYVSVDVTGCLRVILEESDGTAIPLKDLINRLVNYDAVVGLSPLKIQIMYKDEHNYNVPLDFKALKARDERLKLEARIDELKRVILGYHSVTEVLNRIDQLEAEKEDKQ